jgi:DNA-directed RNA polymerase subunit alpha
MRLENNILLPSKPRVVTEDKIKGTYEIDGLYPGYGHTLGNSLRRIILSSLPGAAITKVKISGAEHEFSTMDGIKEDVITILINLKKIRFNLITGESQTVKISTKGPKQVTAEDIKGSGQVEILNADQYICEITDKSATLEMEITIEHGLGFVPKDVHHKEKVEIGAIAVDAVFTPIRRVSYDVEDMRVGDKTNYNRLKMFIETDGSVTPREALESAIRIMITQLQAILDFKVEDERAPVSEEKESAPEAVESEEEKSNNKEEMVDAMKTRIDTLSLPARIENALSNANIRTVGGIARKRAGDLLEIEGIGEKGVQDIKKALFELGITLKD